MSLQYISKNTIFYGNSYPFNYNKQLINVDKVDYTKKDKVIHLICIKSSPELHLLLLNLLNLQLLLCSFFLCSSSSSSFLSFSFANISCCSLAVTTHSLRKSLQQGSFNLGQEHPKVRQGNSNTRPLPKFEYITLVPKFGTIYRNFDTITV